MDNAKIAAAVALALGGFSAAYGAAPAVTTCQTPNATLYVAGSSAAQNAFANAVSTDLFGGTANLLTFSATSGNFEAFCGIAANSNSGIASGSVVLIQYRGEGGSVTGALPIASGSKIKFLDLTTSDTTIATLSPNTASIVAVPTTGSSASNGTNDSWGPAAILTNHAVEVGVTDVEPGALTGPNYPSAYSTAVFGSASATQLAGLTKTALFQQVFGIAVNTQGLTTTSTSIDLSKEAVANILLDNYGDFNSVPTDNSAQEVSTTSDTITVVNREPGSGTRTATGIYFAGINCGSPTAPANIPEDQSQDYYATGDALKEANLLPGAVTYASIDNLPSTKYPNLVFAYINSVQPTNLNAALGIYDFWFEATFIKGTITSTGGTSLYTWLAHELAALTSAPKVKDILAIPNVAGNTGAVPLTSSGVIYINPYTKNGNSCNLPAETN
jgi:hypothetical protein